VIDVEARGSHRDDSVSAIATSARMILHISLQRGSTVMATMSPTMDTTPGARRAPTDPVREIESFGETGPTQ